MARRDKVILQPVKFRKRIHVAILCLNYPEIDEVIREFDEAEWSTGYRFWHIPLKSDTLDKISNSLKTIATVDISAFKNFLFTEESTFEQKTKKRFQVEQPTKEQLAKILEIEKVFVDRGYSIGTAKVYCSLLKIFFGWYRDKDEKDLTKEDINSFLDKYVEKHSLTTNYRRLILNAICRYFQIVGREDLAKI